jgi:hypothetical protein
MSVNITKYETAALRSELQETNARLRAIQNRLPSGLQPLVSYELLDTWADRVRGPAELLVRVDADPTSFSNVNRQNVVLNCNEWGAGVAEAWALCSLRL